MRPGCTIAWGATGKRASIQAPDLLHPVFARAACSDFAVFREVILEREYEPIRTTSDVRFVLDLGANVGYSSCWFLSVFPHARVLAVEPDNENCGVLRDNLSAYGSRAVVVCGAVWNKPTSLQLAEQRYRDGSACSRQVVECAPGTPGSLRGYDVPELMKLASADRISILKVDIEGAEAVVFDASSGRWLDLVDNIVIELHDDSCFGPATPVFWRAIEGRGFETDRSGEVVICRRVKV